MKASELKRLLRKAGCTMEPGGTNHEKWFSPITKKFFSVPRHNAKEIKTKTAEAILKQAGLK